MQASKMRKVLLYFIIQQLIVYLFTLRPFASLHTLAGASDILAFGLVAELDPVVTACIAKSRGAGALAGVTAYRLRGFDILQSLGEFESERRVVVVTEFQ